MYLEHWMPGRARLRVPKPRSAAQVRRMAGKVGRTKHVRAVQINPDTGSVLVNFSADDPIDMIIDELRTAGIEVLSALPPAAQVRTQSTGSAVVRRVMRQANAALHVRTRGRVDLRLAVPAIYAALAMRNLLRQRGRLLDASWYQLLYWAFDSFHKLHQEATLQGGAGSSGRIVE